jgi:hypothetical protein
MVLTTGPCPSHWANGNFLGNKITKMPGEDLAQLAPARRQRDSMGAERLLWKSIDVLVI